MTYEKLLLECGRQLFVKRENCAVRGKFGTSVEWWRYWQESFDAAGSRVSIFLIHEERSFDVQSESVLGLSASNEGNHARPPASCEANELINCTYTEMMTKLWPNTSKDHEEVKCGSGEWTRQTWAGHWIQLDGCVLSPTCRCISIDEGQSLRRIDSEPLKYGIVIRIWICDWINC